MIRPLWTEVDLKALRHNLKFIRKCLKKNTKAMAIIKQDAYGHGLIPIARELQKQGVDYFGVGSVEEAIILRKNGIKSNTLVLSSVPDKFTKLFLQYKITPTIVDLKFAKKLNNEALRAGRVVPVHVKIDTGMGRLGFYPEESLYLIRQLSKLKNISLEGIYTHFPSADSNREFTNNQIRIFEGFIKDLGKEQITFKFCHCANSAGIVNYPNAHFNMVRPGLMLYIGAIPALSLKTRIIFIKKVKKGESVSYGRTFIAARDKFIAVIAAGYADGYSWALSGCGKVIIKNSFFDIAGRVCMDHIMIDLKDNKKGIKVGDEVILIGKSKNKEISVKDLAKFAKTIPYEILTSLSSNIPRIYK